MRIILPSPQPKRRVTDLDRCVCCRLPIRRGSTVLLCAPCFEEVHFHVGNSRYLACKLHPGRRWLPEEGRGA